MSMSTLNSQLASLASSSHTAGVVHASSRTNNDAIGRGFHHSSKHGHALSTTGDATKKASILYDNAREAAEVTAATLREHAVAALRTLSEENGEVWNIPEFAGGDGLLSLHKLEHFERGTATSQANAVVDKSIEKLLGWLMTMTTECPPPASTDPADVTSNPTLLACLHVIEYLLRKYDLHARPTTARALLRTFLPLQLAHPTAYPSLFSRILALVDLQSIPEWTFLRPYAAKGAPPVSRGGVAKQVARDDALVHVLAEIGRRGMEVCVLEGKLAKEREMKMDGVDDEDGTKSLPARRGISTLLSASASVLVEALYLQSANAQAVVSGGVKESTVRALFPLVLSACRSGGKGEVHCPEWKEWGRLVSSTVATLCPLKHEVRTALADAIVAGLPMGSPRVKGGRKKQQSFAEAMEGTGRASLSADEADDATSGILALLSVLGARSAEKDGGDDDDDGDWEYYLPLLPPPKRRGRNKHVVDYLGCALPPSTYKRLVKGEGLAAALGAAVESLAGLRDEEDNDDEEGANAMVVERVAPLVASIVMHAFRRLEAEAGKLLTEGGDEKGRARFRADRDVLLLLDLIQEPSLAPLWGSNSSALVAAATVHTVASYSGLLTGAKDPSSVIVERYASILRALAATDSLVHDQGVAYAVHAALKHSDDGSGEATASRLGALLGREVASSSAPPKGAPATTERGADAAAVGLLPARVALEHADAAVRLDAVVRLESSIEEGEAIDDDLGRALLRRLAVEDDAAVASAAGAIFASQLKRLAEGDEDGMDVDGEGASSGFASLTDDFEGLAKEAMASLYRWSSVALDDSWSPQTSPEKSKKKGRKKSKGEEDKSPLLNCIKICGTVAKLIFEQVYDEDDDSDPILDQFCSLFLSLGAHANCGTLDEVSEVAVAELLQLFGDDGSCDNVTDLIATHSVSHKILRHFFGQDAHRKASAPKALQSRFLWLALHSYSKLLASDSEELSPGTLQIALELALYQMQFYSKESKKSDTFQWEVEFLGNICQRYLSSVADGRGGGVEKAIMILSSTPSSVSFDEVIKPAITSALSSKSQGGHGLAILVHACLQPPASKEGFSRILALVQGMFEGKNISSKVARECIIPALALVSHPGRDVRERVIELLEQFLSVKKDEMLAEICSKATDKSSPLRSSLMMDGANALPNLLGQIVKYSDSPSSVQKFLIESCKTCASDDKGAFSVGGCEASAVVLSAMEKSGENAFPLSKRWELAGKGLFQAFLSCEGDEFPPPSLCRLRDCVISMLKGVLVNEAQAGDDGLSIQISVGPSRAGRRRSYSIGASESFTTLSPYPEDMLQAILEALPSKSPLLLSKHVVQNVLVRQSWASGVYPKLNSKSRKAVAAALLELRTEQNDELAGSALSGLPLKSPDFVQLLKDVDASQSEMNQSAVVFITDCVQGKLEVLGGIADVTKLSSKLFDQLQLLSSVSKASNSDGDSGGRDYTRVSLLQTLLSIHSHYNSPLSERSGGGKHSPSRRKRSRSHSDVGTVAAHAELLVGLVGGNASVIHPLNSGRGRALSLALLTCLCEESPSTVVSSLLPALMSLAGTSQGTDKKVDTNALGDALAAIVPAYCTHAASANLTLFGLLESLVGKIVLSESENDSLLNHLVDALKILPTKESSSEAIASLAACVMALQAFNLQEPTTASDTDSESSGVDNASQKRLELRILANTTSGVKISVSLSLLQYAEKIMGYICGLSGLSKEESSSSETKVDLSEVVALALRGSDTDEGIPSSDYANLSHAQQRSILYLSINLLQSVRDTLSTPAARRVVRKSKGDDADLCLRLWNELMQTHSNALRAHAKLAGGGAMSSMEKKFWAAAPIATSECLENLQNLLPVPHFLASVSSALSDEGVDIYIRKKSMKLLTDRVAEVNSDSPEASLFIDMVPDLVGQITADQPTTVDGEDSSALMRKAIIMKQGALIAIESFARSLVSDDGKLGASAAAVFLPALASVTKLLNEDVYDGEEASSDVTDAECQLLSSSSLCLSTLVTTLQARCLPQLPTIVKPLVSSLKSVNSLMGEQAFLTGELMQLSILKVLQAIAETLPQFLLPYLPLTFSNNALPSKALQQGSANTAAAQLETALATKVQIRQLIPSLAKALSKNLQSDSGDGNWEEACSIINVMTIAVESSQRSDLSPVIGKIFNGLVLAYGYEGDDDSRPQLLKAANKCFLSLVMKLSEAQLRPLYARLREWRGSIEDKSDEPVSSIRRCAFWSLSAELSKSLRSIFLPCLTSVLPDVIEELEIAVSVLCQRNKKGEGSKRRRVEETDGSDADIDNVAPLQPLLMCLESALKADAHEGGDWTRGDDNQRYNMILNHLGKLLMAQVPGDMPLSSHLSLKEQASTSSYQQLVQGVGTLEHGNVVGCMTALAAAAGNEQLWKPLNFAVLEACGHKRSAVRKAGVSCLLSIIETIGEEYMVLLPECLPVLSELLEDEDEIAGMAKECVRQGEELLGESLEDSLR